MTETPANGKTGFLLYSPFSGKHFFRIYDPLDKSKFVDYNLCAEDIEIQILDNFTALYEPGDDGSLGKLDYNSKTLGRKPANEMTGEEIYKEVRLTSHSWEGSYSDDSYCDSYYEHKRLGLCVTHTVYGSRRHDDPTREKYTISGDPVLGQKLVEEIKKRLIAQQPKKWY